MMMGRIASAAVCAAPLVVVPSPPITAQEDFVPPAIVESAIPFQLKRGEDVVAEMKIHEISTSTPPTDRPIVLIEGIDLDLEGRDFGSFTRQDFEDVLRRPAAFGLQDFWDLLLRNGYDLYLVDIKSWDTTTQDLATLLRLSMDWIFTTRTSQREPFIVVGASLSGRVARLALADAEMLGMPHHTDLYMSVDTPHRGAVFPLGVQRAVEFWSNQFEQLGAFNQFFSWPNAKEVLLRQLETDGQIVCGFLGCRSTRRDLVAPEDDPDDPRKGVPAFKDFDRRCSEAIPLDVTRVAFSNGSRFGGAQSLGELIFKRRMLELRIAAEAADLGSVSSIITSLDAFGD